MGSLVPLLLLRYRRKRGLSADKKIILQYLSTRSLVIITRMLLSEALGRTMLQADTKVQNAPGF